MNLVYVYNTFGGEKKNMGFATFQSMIDYWQSAIELHKQFYTNIKVYTDTAGASLIEGLIDADIIVVDFPRIDDRFWNIGKLYVHSLQIEPYLMIDIDVKLKALQEFTVPVMVEMIRAGRSSKHAHLFELPPIGYIPCSGVIGFNDMLIAHEYSSRAIALIEAAKRFVCDYEMLWTVEETLLAAMSLELNFEINAISVEYEHLGMRKSVA